MRNIDCKLEEYSNQYNKACLGWALSLKRSGNVVSVCNSKVLRQGCIPSQTVKIRMTKHLQLEGFAPYKELQTREARKLKFQRQCL